MAQREGGGRVPASPQTDCLIELLAMGEFYIRVFHGRTEFACMQIKTKVVDFFVMV